MFRIPAPARSNSPCDSPARRADQAAWPRTRPSRTSSCGVIATRQRRPVRRMCAGSCLNWRTSPTKDFLPAGRIPDVAGSRQAARGGVGAGHRRLSLRGDPPALAGVVGRSGAAGGVGRVGTERRPDASVLRRLRTRCPHVLGPASASKPTRTCPSTTTPPPTSTTFSARHQSLHRLCP